MKLNRTLFRKLSLLFSDFALDLVPQLHIFLSIVSNAHRFRVLIHTLEAYSFVLSVIVDTTHNQCERITQSQDNNSSNDTRRC